jgi:hypothetical protein
MVTLGILGVLMVLALGLVLGLLVKDNQSAARPSAKVAFEYDASPTPVSAVTSIATPALEETTRRPLELVWPAENISVAASDLITFVWKWDSEQEDDEGRFIFVLKAGGEAQPLVHEELSLDHRHLVVARSFEPGSFLWTMFVTGTRTRGASVGRLFVVVEPTPVADTPSMPTLGSPD